MSSSHTGESTGDGITEWEYSLDGKDYKYEMRYDKNYNIKTHSSESDPAIDEDLDLDSYTDANEVKERLESFFEDEGGELIHKETKGLELKE